MKSSWRFLFGSIALALVLAPAPGLAAKVNSISSDDLISQLVCWPEDLTFESPEPLPPCEPDQLPIELPRDPELICWPAQSPYDPPPGMKVCADGEFPLPEDELPCWPSTLPFEHPDDLPACEPGVFPLPMELGLIVPVFEDVSPFSENYVSAQTLFHTGILAGCSESPRRLCADEAFNRQELAVVLNRAYQGAAFTPEKPSERPFEDVATELWSSSWIAALKESGLTAGCDEEGRNFCPNRAISRQELVVFALRIQNGDDYQPPAGPSESPFTDLNPEAWSYDWMMDAYQRGIIELCYDGEKGAFMCPDNVVLRADAANILALAID